MAPQCTFTWTTRTTQTKTAPVVQVVHTVQATPHCAATMRRTCAACGQDVGLDGVLTIEKNAPVRLCRACALADEVTQ
jgi:predicted thioesterase